MVIPNLHKLGKKSLFSRKVDKTPAKLVVRDVRDIKELDCGKKSNFEEWRFYHFLYERAQPQAKRWVPYLSP